MSYCFLKAKQVAGCQFLDAGKALRIFCPATGDYHLLDTGFGKSGLVKDEKFIQKIPSRIYSNTDEIKEGLKTTIYFGKKDFSVRKRLKILFRQKVLYDRLMYCRLCCCSTSPKTPI